MKFSPSFLTLLLATLFAAEGLSALGFSFTGQSPLLDDRPAVPGDSPLTYCNPDHDDDILIIDHVNLTPNPPLK
jgi:hypothetical protein